VADAEADAVNAVNAAAVASNRGLWDEWAAIHATSDFYDLDSFRKGGVRLRPYEIEEIGPVEGKSLLHVQCHFGIDTISWARLGARVTGVDFSPVAIDLARGLADELGFAEVRFVQSSVDELPDVLNETFDVVYTSNGVLGWLPDIRRWAAVVARFVKPGGIFYITEIHPIAQAFENEGVSPGELVLRYPYWEHRAPLRFETHGSYADPTAHVETPHEHGWDHGLGEIVTALVDAGLEIRKLREYPFVNWQLDFLEKQADRTWRMPATAGGELPLFFSLLARKPG
jgi:SAM-dependent methyltransferase